MKLFDEIPAERPATPLLDTCEHPAALHDFNATQLRQLADELRAYLLYSVGCTGGHFGAGLGVVELTVALHHILDTPYDRLVWDVGHQAYPHKILTGRREQMSTIRQFGGLAAFPKRDESPYDTFGVGHSSTSISAALGMALAARTKGERRRVCAVIGDGALSAGMAFEALAHAGHVDANMLVILNDNEMSISENVGGMASYLARILVSKPYTVMRENSKRVLSHLPGALELARRTEEHVKGMVSPATLFEEMGFNYVGPIDGHDLPTLVQTLGNMANLEGRSSCISRPARGAAFVPPRPIPSVTTPSPSSRRPPASRLPKKSRARPTRPRRSRKPSPSRASIAMSSASGSATWRRWTRV